MVYGTLSLSGFIFIIENWNLPQSFLASWIWCISGGYLKVPHPGDKTSGEDWSAPVQVDLVDRAGSLADKNLTLGFFKELGLFLVVAGPSSLLVCTALSLVVEKQTEQRNFRVRCWSISFTVGRRFYWVITYDHELSLKINLYLISSFNHLRIESEMKLFMYRKYFSNNFFPERNLFVSDRRYFLIVRGHAVCGFNTAGSWGCFGFW